MNLATFAYSDLDLKLNCYEQIGNIGNILQADAPKRLKLKEASGVVIFLSA